MPTSGSDSEPDQRLQDARPTSGDGKLTFVAGKGGVGRSTVAAGLATAVAADGKRVLVIDAIADGGLAAALESVERPLSLELLRLTTEESLQQYIDLFLPLPLSPNRIGPVAKILDYVATAAPGVREILTLGKVAWELREGDWDHIFVDAPATGHVIELLAAADTLGELIGSGPLASQTEWISALLADSIRCGAVVVVAPEELPVTEALELVGRLAAETQVAVTGLVVNRAPPLVAESAESRRLAAAEGPLGLAVRTAIERSQLWVEQRERLTTTNLPLCSISESDQPVRAVAAVTATVLGWSTP